MREPGYHYRIRLHNYHNRDFPHAWTIGFLYRHGKSVGVFDNGGPVTHPVQNVHTWGERVELPPDEETVVSEVPK